MNQLPLFEQVDEEVVNAIWRGIRDNVLSTQAWHHRNWLYHTTAQSKFGLKVDKDTFELARQYVLSKLEERIKKERPT